MPQHFERIPLGSLYMCPVSCKYHLDEDALTVQRLPERSTQGSAGYDFFSPVHAVIKPGQVVFVPTLIRVSLNPNRYLKCVPRSGLGSKGLNLMNGTGIIDEDYYYSENSGHIIIALVNNSTHHTFDIKPGDRFMQGIISVYETTDDDLSVSSRRIGGLGSTGV
jgi:dUTP pyrophosphatase